MLVVIRWDAVAAAAADDAGGLDPGMLGGYLDRLADAADTGQRLDDAGLADARDTGARAADDGVALRALVDVYLSATWRMWRVLPAVVAAADAAAVREVGEAVLRAADDAVAAAAEGFQAARRWVIRREEAVRREFVDDLLAGTGDIATLLTRAEQFGLDLAAPHVVVVATAATPFRDATSAVTRVEDAAVGTFGGDDVLVTTKAGRLVAVLPAGRAVGAEDAARLVARALRQALGPSVGDADRAAASWRCAVGTVHAGAAGVRHSYNEAGEALALAARLRLPSEVTHAKDLLVYRVLLRDREAMTELIEAVLIPLRQARGGAAPLLATLAAYLDYGGNTTATARALHLSVRAVTYRLARIRELTGLDPADPRERYVLQTAAIGADLLDAPAMPAAEPLSPSRSR